MRMMRLAAAASAAMVAFAAAQCRAAEDAPAWSSVVVTGGAEQKNPTTVIAVGVGDVSHISPWRVRRRHPRTGGERGGSLVTLREALVAVGECIAEDVEMPERTFGFDDDGRLVSVCDVPLGLCGRAQGQPAAGVRLGMDGEVLARALSRDELEKPVRDFDRVEFVPIDGKCPFGEPSTKSAGRERATGETATLVLPGGAQMEMIWCAPGTFMMGSPPTEAGRFDDEPIHQVRLTKGFWLGKYEVTQAQWASVTGANPSRFAGASRPVDSVSWDDCQRFVKLVNTVAGGAARLPTEAEWEYACRAGCAEAVAGSGLLDDMAWYDSNSSKQTHDVGQKPANVWGFHDMHGNVLEWCQDWFSKLDGRATDPQGPATGSFRVLRGGCWFFYARDCRCAYRLKRDPGIRNCIYGFRLACSQEWEP